MNNSIYLETGKKLADLWQKANDTCPEHGARTTNLILSGVFNITETDDTWINASKDKAKKWMAYPAPPNLEFSHGQYIHPFKTKDGKSGVDFLVKELKEKSDTNRACWSLLTMKELLDHEQDRSIPSFMVLQAGISDDHKTLILTAYYRALEVHNFLKINLAELCLIAEEINQRLGSCFDQLLLTIHAFSAYNDPEYSCLEKAEIDYINPKTVMLAVNKPKENLEKIIGWLTEKMRLKESRINPAGLKEIFEAMEMHNHEEKDVRNSLLYPKDVIILLDKINKKIVTHNKLRLSTSQSSRTGESYKNIKELLTQVIEKLTSWK